MRDLSIPRRRSIRGTSSTIDAGSADETQRLRMLDQRRELLARDPAPLATPHVRHVPRGVQRELDPALAP